MKTIATIATFALTLGLASGTSKAQGTTTITETAAQTNASAFANSLVGLDAEARRAAINEAILADSSSADEIVASLIGKFPNEAAKMTEFVVQAVIALPGLDNNAKGNILTDVAMQAVKAAEFIPPTAVDNLVETVNGVKAALAQVGEVFEIFVRRYTTPYAKRSEFVFNPPPDLIGQNTQGQTVISDDGKKLSQ